MREVLLHAGADEAFDRSLVFAQRLLESFGARLHVLYTVDDPLSAGWTAEVSAERMPEVHEAMETEARERLAAVIPLEEQERLGIMIAMATGPADEEIVRYANENRIDLTILQASLGDADAKQLAAAVLEGAQCAVLILR